MHPRFTITEVQDGGGYAVNCKGSDGVYKAKLYVADYADAMLMLEVLEWWDTLKGGLFVEKPKRKKRTTARSTRARTR